MPEEPVDFLTLKQVIESNRRRPRDWERYCTPVADIWGWTEPLPVLPSSRRDSIRKVWKTALCSGLLGVALGTGLGLIYVLRAG